MGGESELQGGIAECLVAGRYAPPYVVVYTYAPRDAAWDGVQLYSTWWGEAVPLPPEMDNTMVELLAPALERWIVDRLSDLWAVPAEVCGAAKEGWARKLPPNDVLVHG